MPQGKTLKQRSRRVDKANRTAATARKTSRIARRVASHCANVKCFCLDEIMASDRGDDPE